MGEFREKLKDHDKEVYDKIKEQEKDKSGDRKNLLISPLNDMIDFNPFQYIPYIKLHQQEKKQEKDSKKVYIADEVGAGKTIETGIIISELMYRKEINKAEHKCLIVCPNLLCKKWRYILKTLFGINAAIIRSLSDITNGFNIVSFDTVSKEVKPEENDKDGEPKELKLLIIDEAHNASGKRFDKVKKIRDKCKDGYVILLSATPVSGKEKEEDIKNQLCLLHGGDYGPTGDDKNFFASSEDNDYLCKNKKAYMRYAANPESYKKVTTVIKNHFVENKELEDFLKDVGQKLFSGKNTLLLYTGMNTIISSPAAADKYFQKFLEEKDDQKILDYLKNSHEYSEDDDSEDEDEFVEKEYAFKDVGNIRKCIKKIDERLQEIINEPSKDKKLKKLYEIIEHNKKHFDEWQRDKKNPDKKELKFFGHVLVFTDRVSTACYLKEKLEKDYKHVFRVTGELPESEKLNILQQYKDVTDEISILIITNVACEGQDMDYGNTIVNYDLNYNPVLLEQRRGRVDRFEVKKENVYIHNFAVKNVDFDPEFKVNPDDELKKYSKVEKIYDKICDIYENTNVFYEILQNKDDFLKIRKEDLKEENLGKEDLEKKVKEIYGSVLGLTEEIQESDAEIPSSIKELRERLIQNIMDEIDGSQKEGDADERVTAYVDRLMRKDGLSVQTKDGKVVITVDKKNQEFLDMVYCGGTRISHIIARG